MLIKDLGTVVLDLLRGRTVHPPRGPSYLTWSTVGSLDQDDLVVGANDQGGVQGR